MRLKIEELKSIFKQVALKDAVVYLKAENENCYLRVYNNTLDFDFKLNYVDLRENEIVEFLTDLKQLSGLVNKLIDEEISLNVDDNSLYLQTGKSLYQLSLYELTMLKSKETIFNKCITCDLEKFKNAIRKVMFAINPNTNKVVLQGLHLYVVPDYNENEKCLVLETTNSCVLAEYELNKVFATINQDINIIIPYETLQNILLLNGKELSIDLNENKTIVNFECENINFNSVLISGDYPSLEKIYKMYCDIKTTFNKEELTNALNRLSLFSNVIKLNLQDKSFEGIGDRNCLEKVEVAINISIDFSINLKIADLLNAIKQVDDIKINIDFLESRKPFKIIDGDLLIVLTPTSVY